MKETSDSIARVRDLRVHYQLKGELFSMAAKKILKAVDGVSFDLKKGEVLGLVGESGCGKSSLGRAFIRLHEPTGGTIEIDGQDFISLKGEDLRKARTRVQMIFQDPYASLDPRMTVFEILAEPLKAHLKLSSAQLSTKVISMLGKVGLPTRALKKYPHEFSGGQRQRIAIGRALILEPKILVADEPVSSLDVSVQAQVLNLLKDLQAEMGLSMLFISHNLAVVKYISDRIAVMYLGKIVELSEAPSLYARPRHPYTQALVSAVPIPDPKKERARVRLQLKGELPSPVNPPSGCTFHTRCPWVVPRCKQETPRLEPLGSSTIVSCFEADKK